MGFGLAPSTLQGEGWGRSGGFEPHAARPLSDAGLRAGMRTASEGECGPCPWLAWQHCTLTPALSLEGRGSETARRQIARFHARPGRPLSTSKGFGLAPSPFQGEGWGRSGGFEPHAASPLSDAGLRAGMRTASEGECGPCPRLACQHCTLTPALSLEGRGSETTNRHAAHAVHARPPRMSALFSISTRTTMASATRFIRMAEPP